MATTLVEGFNTQPNGTVPSTANTGFTAVNAGASVIDTSLKFEGAGSLDGSGSAIFRLPQASAQTRNYVAWYLYPETSPSSNTSIFQARTTDATGALALEAQITTGRVLRLRNSSSVAVATMTTALPPNQWSRVEVGFDNGTMVLRAFTGSNVEGTTPTEQVSSTYANTTVDWQGWGQLTAATWDWHMDTVRMNPDTWVGPFAAAPTPAPLGLQYGSYAL